jgi:hypothetical protein
MAISDSQKLDFVWKKLGYGAAKTDINSNKLAANEAIVSPLLLRGDKILTEVSSVPAVIPATSTSIVTVYSTPVECVNDVTASANRTWKTELTDWITPEFGSTYLIKVYIHTAGDAAGAAGISNQVFVTGSGNNDEWFFDYQAGVLNFIGDNLPSGKSFTGKSVYISGARYVGSFGLSAVASGGLSVKEANDSPNVDVSNASAIRFNTTDGFQLTDEGSGSVLVEYTAGASNLTDLGITDGTAGQVLSTDGSENYQFIDSILTGTVPTGEVFAVGSIQTAFTLATTPADAEAIDVYVDGVIQVPGASENFSVSGNTLTFTSAVQAGSEVFVKHRTPHATVAAVNANSITNNNLNLTYTSNEFTGDGTTTDYTIQAEHTVDSVLVFVAGLLVSTSTYTISGSTLSFTTAPTVGQDIFFRYMPV